MVLFNKNVEMVAVYIKSSAKSIILFFKVKFSPIYINDQPILFENL